MNDLNLSKMRQAESDHDIIYSLRTAHQHQTQMLILADYKANILIGLVIVILTILGTRANLQTNMDEIYLFTLGCFVALELIALYFSFLVLFPKSFLKKQNQDIRSIHNIFYFDSFCRYKEDDYVQYLAEKINSSSDAREHLLRDYYQIGKILKRKYRLLRYAYLFALTGLFTVIFAYGYYLYLHL
jgi:hypothetical protein